MNCCNWPTPSPARRIKPTRRSVSGVISFGGRPIPFESTLERDFLLRTTFFSDVREIVPQPVAIPFVARNGRSYTYTPDYLVYLRDWSSRRTPYPKPLLVEVKPESEWRKNWRKWLPKWKAAYAFAQERGWSFHIRDESRIRDSAFANIVFLERYKRMSFPEEDTRDILHSVELMGCAPIHHLLAKHFRGGEWVWAQGLAHIWHLIAMRRLDCDIHRPLNEHTEVWLPCYE